MTVLSLTGWRRTGFRSRGSPRSGWASGWSRWHSREPPASSTCHPRPQIRCLRRGASEPSTCVLMRSATGRQPAACRGWPCRRHRGVVTQPCGSTSRPTAAPNGRPSCSLPVSGSRPPRWHRPGRLRHRFRFLRRPPIQFHRQCPPQLLHRRLLRHPSLCLHLRLSRCRTRYRRQPRPPLRTRRRCHQRAPPPSARFRSGGRFRCCREPVRHSRYGWNATLSSRPRRQGTTASPAPGCETGWGWKWRAC